MLGWPSSAATLLLPLILGGLAAVGAEARHGSHRPQQPDPPPLDPPPADPPPADPPPVQPEPTSCESARLKCAFRTGCGRALQSYMVSCPPALQTPTPDQSPACPETCQHALIALTSTDEGKDLMTCKCTDKYCEETKRRTEVCRPHVERATLNETVVSCRLAQWICKADALCSTALDYYHRFCRLMFQGKRCSRRCSNSISILRRQEKAQKLISCRCEGREDDDCAAIRHNMGRLCFPEEGAEVAGGDGDERGRPPRPDAVPAPTPAPTPAAAPAPTPASAPLLVAPAAALFLALLHVT